MGYRKRIRTLINRMLRPLKLEIRRVSCQALIESDNTSVSKIIEKTPQAHLLHYYQLLRSLKLPLPKFEDTGFKAYSQTDEDGLLLYLFSLIGTTNRVCVDVGSGTSYGANTTNLICNWGWKGLLIEGTKEAVRQEKQFFELCKNAGMHPPKVVNAWVTAENINDLIQENDVSGEIDLFCLDLDGVDYWIWKSLNVIQPRVVVVEYMNIWGSDRSVTVPYKPDFNRFDTHPDYFGASLSAFVKLGRSKGYRLVGCNQCGFNAFFVHSGIGEDIFPEIPPERCLQHSMAKDGNKIRLPQVIGYEWIET